MRQTYADDFKASFSKQEEFLSFLKYIEENANWDTIKTKVLKLIPLGNEDVENYTSIGLNEDILKDTARNTELILKAGKQYYPVRDCAIKTILERAGKGKTI